MEKFFWGIGLILAGVYFLYVNYHFHKKLEQDEQQVEERTIWERFMIISLKFENIKSTLVPIGFILLGIILLLASFGIF